MTDLEKQQISELIKQAKEGNQLAFTKLYEKYKQIIYMTIYRIVNNKDAADDLLSITFVKAFSKLDSYVTNISFEMWLKTIAINSSIDYIRRTKKESANYWIDDSDSCFQLSDTAGCSPEEDYIFDETRSMLDSALTRLRFKYRNIIELRSIQNLSYKQISEQLGLTESQVKSRLNRARDKLKQLLTN